MDPIITIFNDVHGSRRHANEFPRVMYIDMPIKCIYLYIYMVSIIILKAVYYPNPPKTWLIVKEDSSPQAVVLFLVQHDNVVGWVEIIIIDHDSPVREVAKFIALDVDS